MSATQPATTFNCVKRRQLQADEVSILTHIYDADVNLAVWQRKLSQQVSGYASWLLSQAQPCAWQEVVARSNTSQRGHELLPEHKHKDGFVADLAEITEMFCCLFELEAVGLRLRVLDKAMCPKFHTDRVPCRLITTYSGAGTQWRNPQYSSDCDVQQINDGEIALLKGDAWQGNEGQGLVHRSPALPAQQKRLLLTLDFG